MAGTFPEKVPATLRNWLVRDTWRETVAVISYLGRLTPAVSNPETRQPIPRQGRLITGATMPPKSYFRLWIAAAVVLVSVATGAALMRGRDPGNPEFGQSGRRQTTATVTRRDFVHVVRLSGTVEAVESTTIATPRLAGPNVAVARHHQACQSGRTGPERRPHRRVRSPDAARRGPRSTSRAERARSADPQEGRRGAHGQVARRRRDSAR